MILWCIALGFLFMTIEFIVPGIGFFALASLISFLIALYYSMGATILAAIVVSGVLFIGVIGFFLIIKRLPKSRFGKKISNNISLENSDGYVSNPVEIELLNAVGIAKTVLRPAGTGMFGDKYVDVVTEGEFLTKGTAIRVIRIEGARVVVRKEL